VAATGRPVEAESEANEFHSELTAMLDAPLDDEALRGLLMSLVEEAARLREHNQDTGKTR